MARQTMYKNLSKRAKLIMLLKLTRQAESYNDARSGKDCYKGISNGKVVYYFVGNAGGIRVNLKPAVTGSQSRTEVFNKLLEQYNGIIEAAYNAGTLQP